MNSLKRMVPTDKITLNHDYLEDLYIVQLMVSPRNGFMSKSQIINSCYSGSFRLIVAEVLIFSVAFFLLILYLSPINSLIITPLIKAHQTVLHPNYPNAEG